MASDYVLVPMKPDRFSVLGFGHIQTALQTFRNTYPDPHGVVMVVSNSLKAKFALHVEREPYSVQSSVEYEQEPIPGALDYVPAIHKEARLDNV